MTEMRAILCSTYGDWRELELRMVPRPVLGPGQVRIHVKHAGVGFALSLFVAGKYQRKPPLPFIPGTEVSGVVVECAPDVEGLEPGQAVVAALDWGGYAEEVVTTKETVYALPDGVSLAESAALPITYGTAWSALEWKAQVEPGQTVLVHGSSGALGMACVQLANHMGATVIATASTQEKRQAALSNGAAHALSADAGDLAKAVKELTEGTGVDVVLDPVGGDLFDASLRCVRQGGRIVTLGYASGRIPQVPANVLLVKNIRALGHNYGYFIGWGLTDERRRYEVKVKDMMATVLEAVASGSVAPPKIERYPIEDWESAVDAVMSRRSIGKVILDV